MIDFFEVIRLIQLCFQRIRGGNDMPHGGGKIPAFIKELVEVNHRIWETEARSRGETDLLTVGRHKRNLDSYNDLRSRLIDQIDAWVKLDLESKHVFNTATRCYSETLGHIFDRLTILVLRIEILKASAHRAAVEQPAESTKLMTAAEKLELELTHLRHAAQQMANAIYAGEARYAAWSHPRLYDVEMMQTRLIPLVASA